MNSKQESSRPGAQGQETSPQADPWTRGFWISLAILLGLQVLAFHDLRHDDAFISYRYGQNLAEGFGLVFNPGERIMGSTSPGQVLLTALLYPWVGQAALPTWMSLLGCVAWSAQAAALFLLLRGPLSRPWAAGVALVIASGAAGSASWVALETHVPVACVLFAFVAALDHRWRLAAALVAVGGLFRPDAFLAGLLLALPCIRDLRGGAWRPALVGLALGLPWIVFAWIYFGSPLPHSLAAKAQVSSLSGYALHVMQHPGPLVLLGRNEVAHLFVWVLAVLGSVTLVRQERRLWLLPAYAGLHLAAYVVLAPPIAHVWHLYPGALVVSALALSGIVALGRYASATGRPLALPAATALGLLLVAHLYRSGEFALGHRDAYWHGARDAAYRELSEYLVANLESGERVASAEVGTIAYYSRLPIFDLAHLVSPDVGKVPSDLRYWALPPGWGGVSAARPPIAAFAPSRFEVRLYTTEPR